MPGIAVVISPEMQNGHADVMVGVVDMVLMQAAHCRQRSCSIIMRESKLIDAGGRLQSAILGDMPWRDALDGVAEAAEARGAALIPVSAGFAECPFSRDIEELGHAYLTTQWRRHDFRLAAMSKLLRTGVAVDQDIVASEAMERMAYYKDFLEPLGAWWFAGVPFRAGEHVFVLTVQRSRAQGPVVEAEQDMLRRLGCDLSRSATVAARIAAARINGVLDGLEAMSTPAVLLDGEGCVLQANAAAATYECELRLRTGHPIAALTAANRELQAHLRAAMRRPTPSDDPELRPVFLRREGRRPLLLRVRRLTGAAADVFSAARAIVLIDDLDRRDYPSTTLLCDGFGLTPAQARVAALVGGGASLSDCADRLGITVGTARLQLKRVFQSLGVSRQAELVAVLARLRSRGEPRR